MTQADTYTKLNEIFRDVFDDDELTVGSETTAADVPGWDSQAHISLIVAVEIRFGIKFRTAELEKLHNISEFVRLIDEKQIRS
jgi:acyl carrier protein